MSGMKVNYDKTLVYRLGSTKNTDAKFYSKNKISLMNEPRNILGYYASNNLGTSYHLNCLIHYLERVNKVLSLWYHRGISLFGKILVLNTLVSSLFTG